MSNELTVLSVRISQTLKDTIEKFYKDLPVKGRPSSISALIHKDLEELYGNGS